MFFIYLKLLVSNTVVLNYNCSYYFNVLSKSTHKPYCQFHSISFGYLYRNDFVSISSSPVFLIHVLRVNALLSLQLFRRVAAALPGMESLDDANPEGSIL